MENHDTTSSHNTRLTLLLLVVAATAVVAPMFFLGNASGHDFEFHLSSWLDVAGQWHEGTVFPRWCEWANWGFGEPRFVFYPPASWMAGAALGAALPWRMAPGAFIWLCLVGGGLAMWRFARDWLAPPQALAAAVFFAVNPYHLVVAYYRSDFAELLASALFPLMIWGAARVLERGWREVPMLSAVFAVIWLSNAPAAVIATYSVVLLFAVGMILRRSLRRAGAAVVSVAGGFGMAAFYILPAAYEQRWVQIGQVLSENLRPDENFLFTHANDPEFVLFNWKVSAIALAAILITGIAAVFAARRKNSYAPIWWLLIALAGACVFLMFPLSILLWRILPKLQFVQFPWRWLVPLGVVFGFMVGAATGNVRRAWVIWVAVIATLGAGATLMVRDAWWDSEDIPFLQAGIAADHGFDGSDEYAPVACDRYSMPSADPRVSTLDDDGNPKAADDPGAARVQILKWTAEEKVFTSDAAGAATLGIRLLDYPAWALQVDGKAALAKVRSVTGRIEIDLPPGAHRVELLFGRTWDRTAGDIVSLLTALLLIFWALRTRRDSTA